MKAAARAYASGKTTISTPPMRVLEREHRHLVAFARLQLPAGGDDAADRRVGLHRLAAAGPPGVAGVRHRLRLGEIGDGLGAEQLQRVGVAIDGMAAPVETERLLLEAELLGLRPRRRLGQRMPPPPAAALAISSSLGPNRPPCP